MKRVLMLAAACLSLAGCANLNSISRTDSLSPGTRAHFADAKQWAVISQQVDGTSAGKYRTCAQPPPDAFSVLASSFAGQLSGSLGPGDAATREFRGQLAGAISESGASISRTQTVNLLRESMYRTCERYMNGALSEDQFVIQAARDQRAMIAVLAVEQLTGVVMPKPTVLVSNASATSTDAPMDVIKRYEAYRQALKDADAKVTAYDTAKKAHDTAQGGKCATILAANPKPTTDPDLKNWNECDGLKKALDAAGDIEALKKTQAAAKVDFDNIQLIIKGGPGGQGALSNAGGTAGDGVDPASPSDRTAVANAVSTITAMAFSDQSELMFVCVTELRKPANQVNAALQKACLEYMTVRTIQETQQSVLARYGAAPVDVQLDTSQSLFAVFAPAVMTNNQVIETSVRAIVAAAKTSCINCFGLPSRDDDLAKSADRAKLLQNFMTYPLREQMMLAESARQKR